MGTVTEIYDYLRLLWARVGTPHCPNCGKEVDEHWHFCQNCGTPLK